MNQQEYNNLWFFVEKEMNKLESDLNLIEDKKLVEKAKKKLMNRLGKMRFNE